MIAGLLALALTVGDTLRAAPTGVDTMLAGAAVALVEPADVNIALGSLNPASLRIGPRPLTMVIDTLEVRRQTAPIEYSEWYGRRVAIHRALSWTMLPLFAVSYYTGNRLAEDGRAASPQWVRTAHPYAAGGAAAVFGANTVTGLWNLWAARKDPEGRTRRILHSTLFLVADAGFAYAGSIGRDGRENAEIRSRHRTIALSSMGVSTAGWLVMLIGQ